MAKEHQSPIPAERIEKAILLIRSPLTECGGVLPTPLPQKAF